jgi:KUP system potassium uptake protein
MHSSRLKGEAGGIIKAFGLVFGDIGTSPIYTLSVIVPLITVVTGDVLGIVSLIVWTLTILVFVEYVFLVMSLDLHGEGGTLILRRIMNEVVKKKKAAAFFGLMAFIGVSLLLGESVITPAISILSAVEGLELIPVFSGISQHSLIVIAMVITIALFVFQPLGADRVSITFGPIMVLWFLALTISGLMSISKNPIVINALNPTYAVNFLTHHGIAGVLLLSQVILCATGVEALYADMGHLGRKPIVRAWNFVFIALVINYLGQGAFILDHSNSTNVFFSMFRDVFPSLYIPFLVLTVIATIIASQSLISGMFSIVYQGINSGAFPRLKVSFTSNRLKSQIYIGSVNFTLMLAVLLMLLVFKKTGNLAVAYGLSVTGTMCVTGTLITSIFFAKGKYFKMSLALIVTLLDLVFFLTNLKKVPYGGYWSLILASIPLSMILLWTFGQKKVYRNLRSLDIETFLPGYTQIYNKGKNIPGIALYFVGNPNSVSPYIIHCIVRSGIIYERNILLSVHRTDYPYGIETKHDENLGNGLESFEICAGYKEDIDIEKILKAVKIDPKVIFYGMEDIKTKNFIWWIFSIVKKLSPSFVKYYKIPGAKLHGVISRVEM